MVALLSAATPLKKNWFSTRVTYTPTTRFTQAQAKDYVFCTILNIGEKINRSHTHTPTENNTPDPQTTTSLYIGEPGHPTGSAREGMVALFCAAA